MSNCILWFLSDGHKKNPNWQNPTILTLYLSDRHQAVVVDGHVKPITAGVPQREQAWSFVIHHLYQWTASTASVERADLKFGRRRSRVDRADAQVWNGLIKSLSRGVQVWTGLQKFGPSCSSWAEAFMGWFWVWRTRKQSGPKSQEVRESESPGVRGVRDSQETVGSGWHSLRSELLYISIRKQKKTIKRRKK